MRIYYNIRFLFQLLCWFYITKTKRWQSIRKLRNTISYFMVVISWRLPARLFWSLPMHKSTNYRCFFFSAPLNYLASNPYKGEKKKHIWVVRLLDFWIRIPETSNPVSRRLLIGGLECSCSDYTGGKIPCFAIFFALSRFPGQPINFTRIIQNLVRVARSHESQMLV